MRTLDDLLGAIADDLVWRRKELTELRALIQTHDGQLKQRVLIRSAIALLYAHWEGFVKKCASNYLEFVSYQRHNCDDLATNFLVLAARKASDTTKSTDMTVGMRLADFYLNCAGKQARIPFRNVINTKSNLSSEVLKDILSVVGLDLAAFSTRFAFIDSNLLNPRNHVAHGDVLNISTSEYLQLHEDVLTLIETFRTAVENAAATKAYLKTAA
jgi:hypothetical protein